VTCGEASQFRTYVGCDYWPTVTANVVDPNFDYALVVANTQASAANVTITGPGGVNVTKSVAPNGLEKFLLPWVTELKNTQTTGVAVKGAYHLVSSVPVVVYQFSALQYSKNGAYSYTNDASLLLPSTAMTGTYRIAGPNGQGSGLSYPDLYAVTATADGTTVKSSVSGTVTLNAGDVWRCSDPPPILTIFLEASSQRTSLYR
jgi:hypothetical protein